MKKVIETVDLHHVETDKVTPTQLYHGIDADNLKHIDEHWRPIFDAAPGAQDGHWQWELKKLSTITNPLVYDIFALETDGLTQALMLTAKGGLNCFCRHNDHTRAPLVYVELLATAPWNRSTKVGAARYKGCGTVMLATAVSLSLNEGFEGRIGLHSLTDAEPYYRDWMGMTEFGNDSSHQNLNYFEFSTKQAQNFLTKRNRT